KRSDYFLDPLGRLALKKTSSGDEIYFYDGTMEIGAKSQAGSSLKISLPEKRGRPVLIFQNGSPFIAAADVQNNIRSVRSLRWFGGSETFDYSSFGESATGGCPYRYHSYRFDPDSGLYRIGKRCYDPALGVWTTPDPALSLDSLNS